VICRGIGLNRVILTTAIPIWVQRTWRLWLPALVSVSAASDHYLGIKFYDGRLRRSRSHLVARYSSYPDRPWSSSFVGRRTAYAILTCALQPRGVQQPATVPLEVDGIPL